LEEITEESSDDYSLKAVAEVYKKYGTYLTKKVRDAMFELLFKHINECKQLLNTEYVVDDICKLTRTTTGKIQAVEGSHDDSLMSYLHVLYIYYTGDNLLTFGIDKSIHPIIGTIEENIESKEDNLIGGFFTPKVVSYKEMFIEDSIRQEEEIKYLVNTRPNIYKDEVYSKQVNNSDETVDILPYFFSLINN
jgi:hypothetical protein